MFTKGHFTFQLHILVDGTGALHLGNHFVSPSASGIGVTSGTRYVLVSVVHFRENNSDVTDEGIDFVPGHASESTFRNTFKVIAPGADNNFTVVTYSHFTYNANGDLTVDRSYFGEAQCQ